MVFDRLGHYEQAAIISTFAVSDISQATYPEIAVAVAHIREVLGERRYELCVQAGAEMTHAARAAYALDQIERVRTELLDAGESV
jgi:hypothetical protein